MLCELWGISLQVLKSIWPFPWSRTGFPSYQSMPNATAWIISTLWILLFGLCKCDSCPLNRHFHAVGTAGRERGIILKIPQENSHVMYSVVTPMKPNRPIPSLTDMKNLPTCERFIINPFLSLKLHFPCSISHQVCSLHTRLRIVFLL